MEKYRSSLGVITTGGLTGEATSWAGAALLVELYRKAGVEAATERALPKKKSSKGLRQEQMVESFVLLSALGGDCIEDMERLCQDKGLESMLSYHRVFTILCKLFSEKENGRILSVMKNKQRKEGYAHGHGQRPDRINIKGFMERGQG